MIQQCSFERLKPYFVRKLKDRYSCCCQQHIQMIFLKDAMNYMRNPRNGIHGACCDCICQICQKDDASSTCQAGNPSFSSLTSIWEGVLCEKPAASSFHHLKCLMGECGDCGAKRFKSCPHEDMNHAELIPVKVFEEVMTCNQRSKKTKKVKVLTHKQMSCPAVLKMFCTKLTAFIRHNFIYKWQAEQFRECVHFFTHDDVVSVVDFAENYTFKEQNEIQSMHWHSNQVTILVHISYVRIDGDVQKTMHFFISDDKQHDTLFVQHCFILHHGWLKQLGLQLKHHYVWSDGAASQFKAKRPFYFVARYAALTNLKMTWNFFGSGHGKGEHDGAGAVLKRALTHEQLKTDGVRLQCANDVIRFLQSTLANGAHASYPSKERTINRIFWEVRLGEVNRTTEWNCKQIPSTRSLHCVSGYSLRDSTALRTRALSCFCSSCMHSAWNKCKNKAYTKNWQYHRIEPDQPGSEVDDDAYSDATYEGHYDALSDAISIGDNFAVNVEADNDESVDFYIIQCTAQKMQTDKPTPDGWGNTIEADTHVIRGIYYEQCDTINHYRLLDHEPQVLMYSHLVRCIKIPMEVVDSDQKLYNISNETYESIYHSMPLEI